jgi:pimeloyl-ACP methyl ester carboxylesterase
LKVPENYTAPGRSIEIAFMVVSPRHNIDPGYPVIYLSGGPGAPSLVFAEMLVTTPGIHEVVVDRDWVFLDQRGAGRSVPSLRCPSQGEDYLARVKACRDQLITQGVDLSQYNSARSASDVEALRKALGVKQWNLWGASYGSRLAFTVARYYPASVRSIVHDAVELPENQVFVDDFRGTEGALDKLLTKCAVDAACSSKFPQLRSRFLAAILPLREQPVAVGGARFDDNKVLHFIGDSLGGGSGGSPLTFEHRIQSLLAYIDAAARGDGELMLHIEKGMVEEDPCAKTNVPVEGYFSLGQHLSIDCNEEKPFESMGEYQQAAAKSEVLRSLLGDKGGIGVFRQCALWPAGRAEPIENTHVSYDGPQLAFSGELDASLSGRAGYEIEMLYANATNVVFRNAMHGQVHLANCPSTSEDDYRLCALKMARQFLADPQGSLDTRCAQARKLRLVP